MSVVQFSFDFPNFQTRTLSKHLKLVHDRFQSAVTILIAIPTFVVDSKKWKTNRFVRTGPRFYPRPYAVEGKIHSTGQGATSFKSQICLIEEHACHRIPQQRRPCYTGDTDNLFPCGAPCFEKNNHQGGRRVLFGDGGYVWRGFRGPFLGSRCQEGRILKL